MTCVLDAVFAQASLQNGSGLNPVLYVGIFATKMTPYSTPNGPAADSPPGTPIGGSGYGPLTYNPANMIIVQGSPVPVAASFSGEIQYFAGIFEGSEEPPAPEQVSLTMTIMQSGAAGGGEDPYTFNLSSTPSILSGTSAVQNCTAAESGPTDQLTGQFQGVAADTARPGRPAVPGSLYKIAFSVAMRTYVAVSIAPVSWRV